MCVDSSPICTNTRYHSVCVPVCLYISLCVNLSLPLSLARCLHACMPALSTCWCVRASVCEQGPASLSQQIIRIIFTCHLCLSVSPCLLVSVSALPIRVATLRPAQDLDSVDEAERIILDKLVKVSSEVKAPPSPPPPKQVQDLGSRV